MLGFLQSPTTETVVLVYVAYQLLSAAVQSLPTPAEFGGVWYKVFYNFASIIIGDFKSYISKYTNTTSTTVATLQPSGAITASKITDTTTKGE